jgi:hypothetical protein
MAGFLFIWYYECSNCFIMTASITWDIATLDRHLDDGCVYTVHYTVSTEDQGEFASVYGSVGLEAPDADDLIPYQDLDKATVISWVKNKLGTKQVATVEATLEQALQDRLSPKDASGTPW